MRVRNLVALCCAIFLMIIGLAPAANAASAYDDTITTTDELHLLSAYYPCTKEDHTLTWSEIMLDPDKYSNVWGQYIFGADATAVSDAFAAALANGEGWAVSQQNYAGISTNNPGTEFGNSINIQFSPSSTAYVDLGTLGSHTYAYMRNTDGAYVYDVKLSFYKPNGGECTAVVNQTARWNGTYDITWINSNLGGQNFSIATDWVGGDSGFVTDSRPLFVNATINYPSGYEGSYIRSEYTPPVPSASTLSHHSGTVDCMDIEPPAQMLIYQAGNSGSATLTVSSLAGKADWGYDFTDSPYSIAVLCGTKWTYSYGTVTEKNANWYCDPNGQYLRECELG